MNKAELIAALEDSRQELLKMLENLPEAVMLEKGASGDWSIKDILAHLAYWEGQTVTLLFQAQRGVERPTTVHFGDEPADAINARWHQQSLARPLEAVWNDFVGVRKQTIRRVKELSEKDLTDPHRFAWMSGVPLVELILSDTVEHEEEHADEIRAWLDRRSAQNNGANGH